MADNLPSRRIEREALERIIKRAAELQAGEMDTGDGLTEQDLLKLGAEVGIDGRYLRQALYEEGASGAGTPERGFLAKWVGPGHAHASRVVPGDRVTVEQALAQWMTEGEALAVKRRRPDATVWERQKGFMAEMKRGFGVGGRSYALARARDVTVMVTQLEPGYCHVEMVADLTDSRAVAASVGGGVGGTLGLVGVGALALQGPPALVVAIASIPLVSALVVPLIASRTHRTLAARVQLALEQVLDRLEHGEIKDRHRLAAAPGFPLGRVAEEIRKAITDFTEASRTGSRRLPPAS